MNRPYGGLFGNSVQINVVEEIVADPYSDYRPKDLEEIIGASAPSIRRALQNLTNLGLLIKDVGDAQHPVYRPNLDSNKIVALTFLAYAMIDDRDGSECMNTAISDYYMRVLRQEELAVATDTKYIDFGESTSWDEGGLMATIHTGRKATDDEIIVATVGV
ncbi:MAG: hypothetical protein KAT65_17910 [Methanophagales archaeon]|nr:hypothetical protein [Methanophagales archaeon]